MKYCVTEVVPFLLSNSERCRWFVGLESKRPLDVNWFWIHPKENERLLCGFMGLHLLEKLMGEPNREARRLPRQLHVQWSTTHQETKEAAHRISRLSNRGLHNISRLCYLALQNGKIKNARHKIAESTSELGRHCRFVTAP